MSFCAFVVLIVALIVKPISGARSNWGQMSPLKTDVKHAKCNRAILEVYTLGICLLSVFFPGCFSFFPYKKTEIFGPKHSVRTFIDTGRCYRLW